MPFLSTRTRGGSGRVGRMEATHASRWVATAMGVNGRRRAGMGGSGESAVRSARVGKEIETSFGRDRARAEASREAWERAR